ncbi:MAG: hypothetical protein K9H12_13440 [Bacteroidales bacterium]|nr:hypothetical protein [Bacteroidales bacterium]
MSNSVIFSFLSLFSIILGLPVNAQTVKSDTGKRDYTMEAFEFKDLKEWDSFGNGDIENNHGQTVMYENPGSLGYMLVSPKSYGENTKVSFDVMPLNASTVFIVEMAAHNSADYELNLGADYDGNVKYLFDNVQMYMFAFHNAAHNKSGPFVRKYPDPGAEPLAAYQKQIIKSGRYSKIELGMKEGELWLAIDEKKVLRVNDPEYYQAGKIILRLRGTGPETAVCLIKNLKVYSKN